MPSHERKSATETLSQVDLLTTGAIEIEALIESSNYTFLVRVRGNGDETLAIYKPLEGERPLRDFPPGLHRREVAAFVLADALGWPNIPRTVLRDDGPHGEGSLPQFLDADFEQHYFSLFERNELHDAMRDIATFDVVTNNTDRKSGHCLIDNQDVLYAIDNGLCFNIEPKLRTVIWEFGGTEISNERAEKLNDVANDLPSALTQLLSADEITALTARMTELSEHRLLPEVESQWQYPWPLV